MASIDPCFAPSILAVLDEAAQVTVTDADERIVAANANFCSAFGYAIHELLGRSHRLISSGAHGARFWSEMRDTVRRGKTWRQTVCNRTRGGDLIWVDTVIAQRQDGPGYISLRHDVTSQMRMQGRLALKERLLSGATKLVGLGGWSATMRPGMVQWTTTAGQLLGLPPPGAPIVWPAFIAQVGRITGDEAIAGLETLTGGMGTWSWEGRSSDDTRWLAMWAEGMTDKFGQPQIEGAVQDITQRKESELALTAAKQAAEEALAARDRFIAVLSHEMRNPLQGMLGSLQLLQATGDLERKNEYAGLCLDGGRLLLRLLNDILDLAKLEAGRFVIEPAPCDPRNLLRALEGLYAAQARHLGLDLELTLDDGMPRHLLLDEMRLTQVLSNLLANALKFTPAGSVRLRFACLDIDRTQAQVRLRITVSDTGIGIPVEAQGRLFTPFTQVSPSTAKTYGGTGLGLWICGALMREMGGSISVASTPGTGSEFTVELSAGLADSHEALPALRVPRLSGHVLLVEDDPINRLVLSRTLEGLGLACTSAASAEEALQAWQNDHARFNLLITDLELPGMDGCGLVRRLRADPHGSQIPCLALTGSDLDAAAVQLREVGFAGALAKPLTTAGARAALMPFLGT